MLSYSICLFVCFCFQFVLGIIMKILESTMFNTAAFPHAHRHPSLPISKLPKLHIAFTHTSHRASQDTPPFYISSTMLNTAAVPHVYRQPFYSHQHTSPTAHRFHSHSSHTRYIFTAPQDVDTRYTFTD